MTPDDFMVLGPVLKHRLKESVGAAVHVLTASDLEGVAEQKQVTPAVHLLYWGYRPVEADFDGYITMEQTGLTVIAVRNLRDARGGEAARQDAGPIAASVMEGLHRWRPCAPGAKPLTLAAAPQAGYRAGFFYLPLAWTARLTIRGDC